MGKKRRKQHNNMGNTGPMNRFHNLHVIDKCKCYKIRYISYELELMNLNIIAERAACINNRGAISEQPSL